MDNCDLVIEVSGGCVIGVWDIRTNDHMTATRVYVRDWDNIDLENEDCDEGNEDADKLGGIDLSQDPRATRIW